MELDSAQQNKAALYLFISNKDTALYVGLWEELNNENFNFTEYREIRINEIAKKQFDILQHTSGIKKIEQLDNNAPKLLS